MGVGMEIIALRLLFRRIHLPFQQDNCYREPVDWTGLPGSELGSQDDILWMPGWLVRVLGGWEY